MGLSVVVTAAICMELLDGRMSEGVVSCLWRTMLGRLQMMDLRLGLIKRQQILLCLRLTCRDFFLGSQAREDIKTCSLRLCCGRFNLLLESCVVAVRWIVGRSHKWVGSWCLSVCRLYFLWCCSARRIQKIIPTALRLWLFASNRLL